ncbi:vasorin-like isoform X2 [Formica exsecta]|uniref:vasorin-like isoform X1 n=2 Tax=Formica exsecta TaxID=72781 RepID=UPI001142F128|nr:vasorin-like isoform X1 [Formica exsecta]XP_029662251.1 vasorin-like isoform X1 [Formica exsecta]XP_029662252.1 vasorin-like isoform X1 [Formica exsecta]XP_029662253.1 vasorin-like isoform X1 [Formica exsecta]XP_029662254.1 vasorin-like isoform X2 [Formica exsecta]XP_029662256.1 vasorin-like isoform X2 [Formica exsecta]XP_029662257.1 vasorin-like isoform X2 [Formica exsecta]XP_029662258.1 vasorin-like isoform X2 [Formica exsecta]
MMWLGSFIFLAIVVLFVSATTVVDLSFHKLKKETFFVRMQSQYNHLKGVTDLNLKGNEFDSFLDCSTNLENLRTLDLSQNHLVRFFFLCKEEYNLQVLNVSHNKLEYIDDNAFNDRIPKLKILDLSFNKLTVVNETMLQYFTVLEYLSLSHNPIGDGIHESAFWNLEALKHLDLKNISAPYFSSVFFKTLTNLSTLDLSWNPIDTIPLLPINLQELDLSGTQVISFEKLYLPKLRELKLNYMSNLTSFALNDLENLTGLEILSMIGCRRLIQLSLWPQLGVVLPRLQHLSIKECGLETLDIELRALVKRTPVVELDNNPWKCDCKLEWIGLLNSSRNLSRDIRCYAPDQHHGKLLAEIPNYELECEYDSSILYPILWTCLSLIIVFLIIAMIVVFFKRPISQWSFKGKNGDTVTYKNVIESNNDLVRILAVSEAHERNEE